MMIANSDNRVNSAMRVIETTLGTGPWTARSHNWLQRAIVRLLYAVIPAANPNFEGSYEKVRRWWIEIDELGTPQRELGFNEGGEVIVAGPIGRNNGFFTDSNATFSLEDGQGIEQTRFEAEWSEFEGRFSGSES